MEQITSSVYVETENSVYRLTFHDRSAGEGR